MCALSFVKVYNMTEEATKTRTRLSPEKRRSLILDSAAIIVARDGVAQVSMDAIGREAGVSKSLVYNYFENLTELLKELLERELKEQRFHQAKAAENAETFEELVRGVTHEYLSYIAKRGLLIERLQSEPSLSDISNPTDYSRETSVEYLTEIVVRNFGLDRDIARAATDISFGLPAAAGNYLLHSEMELKKIEDLTVTMILGSLSAVNNDNSIRKLKI